MKISFFPFSFYLLKVSLILEFNASVITLPILMHENSQFWEKKKTQEKQAGTEKENTRRNVVNR